MPRPGSMPAHGNHRYVKSARIRLTALLLPLIGALALAAPAQGELVAPVNAQAVLAVGPKSAPVVAYTNRGGLYVARSGSNGWRARRVLALPAGTTYLAGMVVDGRGRPSILAEDLRGGRLVLARLTAQGRWRANTLVKTSSGTLLGQGGIVLDAAGRPAVAYAIRRASNDTFLRLVRLGANGRFRTQAITLEGFPRSSTVPSAAPVLVGRTIHVVEAVGSSAIQWSPTKSTWEGQYIFASFLGSTVGAVAARMVQGTLHAALTLDLGDGEQSFVFSITSRGTQESTLVFPHALLAAIAVPRTGPEVAANDFVGNGIYAGLVGTPDLAVEIDGRIDGYAATSDGSRYLLLAHPTGLEFYAVPSLLQVTLSLSAVASGNAVTVGGAVSRTNDGEVQLYYETASQRTLAAVIPIRADGTYEATIAAPPAGAYLRAVYREPTTGLPYASLLRTSCCASPTG
jgi:hypothetical protein